MNRRVFLTLGVAGLASVHRSSAFPLAATPTLAAGAAPAPPAGAAPISAEEHARTIAALAPPKRA